jgi:hypothetical protein
MPYAPSEVRLDMHRHTMSLMELVGWGVATMIGAFVGSFLAGYLKKKGENLATHEDIGKLVEQMEATKEIEAAISSRVWERQRKWELKRDALFEAIQGLRDVEYGLSKMVVAYTSKGVPPEAESKAMDAWDGALANFKRSRILAYLVCDTEVKRAFDDIEQFFVAVIKGVQIPAEIPEWFPAFRKQLNKLLDAVHAELTCQSTGSLEVQAPGSRACG